MFLLIPLGGWGEHRCKDFPNNNKYRTNKSIENDMIPTGTKVSTGCHPTNTILYYPPTSPEDRACENEFPIIS